MLESHVSHVNAQGSDFVSAGQGPPQCSSEARVGPSPAAGKPKLQQSRADDRSSFPIAAPRQKHPSILARTSTTHTAAPNSRTTTAILLPVCRSHRSIRTQRSKPRPRNASSSHGQRVQHLRRAGRHRGPQSRRVVLFAKGGESSVRRRPQPIINHAQTRC